MHHAFTSVEELFAAVETLVRRLELAGLVEAAGELEAGYACLNGLTDGWALFLESIERVRSSWPDELDREDRDLLDVIRRDVKQAVFRR